jgi:hypothetical protein
LAEEPRRERVSPLSPARLRGRGASNTPTLFRPARQRGLRLLFYAPGEACIRASGPRPKDPIHEARRADASSGVCKRRMPVGSECAADALCETLSCVDGACARNEDGDACGADEHCVSGVCNPEYRCGAKPDDCP